MARLRPTVLATTAVRLIALATRAKGIVLLRVANAQTSSIPFPFDLIGSELAASWPPF